MLAGRGRALLGRCAVLAVVALLAACTGGDDGEDPRDPERAPALPEGTVRLGVGGPLVVDPVDASLAAPRDLMVLDLLHDGLTRLDADGVAQPALASGWDANATSTAFRFVLAADATFASGRPITPEDVIASFERVLAAGDTSLAALSLEAVKGFSAFASGKAEHVSGLTAAGPRTVRIELVGPLSVLPTVLSDPILSVVDPETIEGGLGALDLSGDWAVASADGGNLVLDRREGAPGELQHVELHTSPDDGAAYEAFEAGEVDWAEVPSDQVAEAVEAYGDDAFAPFQAELFFGMNVASAGLRSEPLRRAIQLAIDREAIVEEVYPDRADPLSTIVPAGVPGHDADRCESCQFDADAAADIIEFAFPDGDVPLIGIDYDESPLQQQMAEMVAADLDDVGIRTRLRPQPLEEYKTFVVSGEQHLFSFGWIGAYVSPDAYLAPLFGSSANDNLTNYRSDQVDGLLERARASEDPAKNAERWALAERVVLEAAVVVPIAQFRSQAVVADRVQGLAPAVDGTVDWSQVTVDG